MGWDTLLRRSEVVNGTDGVKSRFNTSKQIPTTVLSEVNTPRCCVPLGTYALHPPSLGPRNVLQRYGLPYRHDTIGKQLIQ